MTISHTSVVHFLLGAKSWPPVTPQKQAIMPLVDMQNPFASTETSAKTMIGSPSRCSSVTRWRMQPKTEREQANSSDLCLRYRQCLDTVLQATQRVDLSMLSNGLVRYIAAGVIKCAHIHGQLNLIMIDRSSSSRYLILSEMFVTSKLARCFACCPLGLSAPVCMVLTATAGIC